MPIDSATPSDLNEKSEHDISATTFKPPNQETSIITRDTLPTQQQFCLRWNNYQTNLTFVFDQLLQTEAFCDVTLACDKGSIKAHKMVLSACSPYFQALFFDNPCQHPIIIMKDVKWHELKAIVEFMYKGEINVGQDQIGGLLKLAEMLKIRGLADVNGEGETNVKVPASTILKTEPECKKPRTSADFDISGVETPAPMPKNRKRKWSLNEGSGPDSPADDNILENIETASPIPPTSSSNVNPPKTPTAISPFPPIAPALDNMNLSALTINQPDDMEIKPGIAEMIREEERAKLLENSQAWLQNSTSSTIAAESYQYQLQSMWQKCWNSQNLIHHLRFRERGPLKSWRPETMAEAIFSVLKEGLSLSQAARKFDIPYPTFVLYANRVHNMLGPSIDGGTDLRPKGRGRPQRILLGIWPDEHIKGVIKSVVFRDAKDLKEEQMHLYGRQSPFGFQDPAAAMNFPGNTNGLGQSMPPPQSESLSPDAVTAATVAAVRQQMCNMVAAAQHDASLMNNFNLPPHLGGGSLTIHPSGTDGGSLSNCSTNIPKTSSSPNNQSLQNMSEGIPRLGTPTNFNKSSRTSSSPTTSSRYAGNNNNNKQQDDCNNTTLAHLNSSNSVSITRLGTTSLAHDLRMLSSGENSPEMAIEPAVNLALGDGTSFKHSREYLSPSSASSSHTTEHLYQQQHDIDYGNGGRLNSFKENTQIKLEPNNLTELRSD